MFVGKKSNRINLRGLLTGGLLLVLLVLLVIIFNKTTTANNLAGCESCEKSAQSNLNLVPKEPEISNAELEKMQAEIYNNKYTFTVSQNANEFHLCGMNPNLLEASPTAPMITELKALPSKWDWREQNGVTPVRNQGNCGSCWAFAAVGVMESAIKIKDGVSTDLSEQYLVSCNSDGWGCNGGWWAHKYHVTPGAVLESCFPYQAADVACKSSCDHPYKLDKWGYVGNSSSIPSVEALKTAIYQYGPISVTVAVDSYFSAYSGGVFNRNYTGSINHAVILVGWDDSQQCWIMRNSWGASWGESGYMRIGYNISKIGYGATYVVYKGGIPTPTPTINPSPTPTIQPSPIPSPSPNGNNLALNKTVTVSSYYQSYYPKYAVDGDLDSRWASVASNQQWLNVNLGANYQLNSLRIKWSKTNYPKKYRLSWNNGSKEITSDGDWDQIALSNVVTNWIKVDCLTANSSYYVVYEYEVYGK